MRLYLIRHGQSVSNAEWDASGLRQVRVEDPVLTDLGRRQAADLAAVIGARRGTSEGPVDGLFGISRLYSSLMLRAVETGAILGPALGAPWVAWTDTHEVGGMYVEDETGQTFLSRPGSGRAYFASRYPELALPADLSDEGWWLRPFETDSERPARARRVWDALGNRHAGDSIALITHLGFYNQIMAIALGLPPPALSQVWFELDNCAITILETGVRVRVISANLKAVRSGSQ